MTALLGGNATNHKTTHCYSMDMMTAPSHGLRPWGPSSSQRELGWGVFHKSVHGGSLRHQGNAANKFTSYYELKV